MAYLPGTDGNDRDLTTGTAEADLIEGFAGNDSITGAGGNDTLRGGTGDDIFYIGGTDFGQDRFEGDEGADRIRLSSSIEVTSLLLNAANMTSVETLDFSAYNILGTGNNDVFDISGITSTLSYRTIYLQDGDDSFIGFGGTDNVNGGSGNDTLSGGSGGDYLTGGSGNDTLNGGSGDDYFYIGGTDSGTDRFNGGDGTDRVRLTSDLITSNLLLTSTYFASTETLDFSAYDVMGTDNDDVFNISGITSTLSYRTIHLGDGYDSFVGHVGADFVNGGSGNDTLSGGSGSDYLTGGSGRDDMIGGSGDDTFYIGGTDYTEDRFLGGDGSDRIRLTSDLVVSRLLMTADYVATTETLDFSAYEIMGTDANDSINISGITSILSYRWIEMGDGNDSFLGYTGSDYVDGGAGNDTLRGGSGNDYIIGGSGNDILEGGSGDDTFYIGGSDFGQDYYFGGGGGDRIRLTSDVYAQVLNLSAGRVHDTVMLDFAAYEISGTDAADRIDLRGISVTLNYRWIELGDGNDIFFGFSGSDYVDGGAGNDTLIGGAGSDDRLTGGSGVDKVDYTAATGGVRVDLRLTGAQAIGGGQGSDTLNSIENVTGSSRNDVLTGNASANVLSGGAGNDTLIGALGNDVLDGGAGLDTVSYSITGAGVSVRLAVTGGQNVGAGQGWDKLIGIENVTGSGFADRLEGNAGANLISGLGGNDNLLGGVGNDQLFGGDGNDQLIGGWGNDRLQGQNGNDALFGNGGADSFRFDLLDGTDRIADWQDGVDTIVLESGSWNGRRYDDFSDLSITQSAGSAIVAFGGTSIVVVGVQASSLTAADFDFV